MGDTRYKCLQKRSPLYKSSSENESKKLRKICNEKGGLCLLIKELIDLLIRSYIEIFNYMSP